jgi:hypothetical protein
MINIDWCKLICIDDETDALNFGDGIKELTWGKEYHIITDLYNYVDGRRYVSLINDKGKRNDYLINRFVQLERFREIQLNKLGI